MEQRPSRTTLEGVLRWFDRPINNGILEGITRCICPCCGHVSKDNRRTQAKFLCVDCGYENHADIVGAIHVLERGYRLLACGDSVQSGRSMKQEPTEATQAVFV